MQLYMYDVRGIQDYIFRTNKIKEIIGASFLVENIVIKIFKKATENLSNVEYATNDLHSSLKIFDNDKINAEIFTYGGGVLVVLFRSEEIGEIVSDKMKKLLIEETYSLKLAVAHVEVTGIDEYKEDYNSLKKEMENVKSNMFMSTPVNGFPMTLNDPVTGFPFSKKYDDKYVTYDSYQKLLSYSNNVKKEKYDLEFAREENNSLIAVIHIDGNTMGIHIREMMKNVKNYNDAAEKMRSISEKIQSTFIDKALKNTKMNIERFCDNVGLEINQKKLPFRVIISAGDDITFICNAKIALQCVNSFMKELEGSGFSACAGIYVTHSHFPFSRAYEYAEQLCKNAKRLSRKEPGNYIDFHINTSGILNDINDIRKKYYQDVTGKSLIARPYKIGESIKYYSISQYIEMMKMVTDKKIARSKMKNLRPYFLQGEEFVKNQLYIINSRLKKENQFDLKENENEDDNKVYSDINYTILFDVIETMDLRWGDGIE